ncbi:major facilitator superfamily transporter [Xylariaceae sp. FL1272]|nr:major facilitator superfamily transporter [Xylariaceae sp. FL1272]
MEKTNSNIDAMSVFNGGDTDKDTGIETDTTADNVPVFHSSPPPDGGLEAWLVLVGAFVIMIYTYGLVNSFGVFQTYYETELLTDRSSSDISWVGSLQAALLSLTGIVSGPLCDMGYVRPMVVAGLLLELLGMFTTSLCSEYWQVIIAQGLTVGLGSGLLFLTSTAVLSQYFARRRALVLGIQSVGSPLAGIVFPIIFGKLQPLVGFGWATRIIAFILLALAPLPLVFLKPRLPPPAQGRGFIDQSALTDIPFILLGFAVFFAFLGLYVPIFYVQLYSIRYNIVSESFSPYLVTLLNTGSVFGRLLPNFFADKWGSMEMLIGTMFGAAILAFGWFGVHNAAGIIVFVLLFGFFNGGVTSLPASAIASLTPDLSRLGTRLGMVFVPLGVSVLIGNPIAGAILGDSYVLSSWQGVIAFSGATLLVGSFFMFLSKFFDNKRKKAAALA